MTLSIRFGSLYDFKQTVKFGRLLTGSINKKSSMVYKIKEIRCGHSIYKKVLTNRNINFVIT